MATLKSSSTLAKNGKNKKSIDDSIADLQSQLALYKGNKFLVAKIGDIIRALENEKKRRNKK